MTTAGLRLRCGAAARGVVLALLTMISPPCSLAAEALSQEMAVLRDALLERATRLLVRYGTTFHALGRYVDDEGSVREISPLFAAPLVPERIAESLREALRELPAERLSTVAIATDLPAERMVRIQFEDRAGRCIVFSRAYRFTAPGGVEFATPEQLGPCPPSRLLDRAVEQTKSLPPVLGAVGNGRERLLCPCEFNSVGERDEPGSYGSGPRVLVVAPHTSPAYATVNPGAGAVQLATRRPLRYRCEIGELANPSWFAHDLQIDAYLEVTGQGNEACWFRGRLEARSMGGTSSTPIRGACGC